MHFLVQSQFFLNYMIFLVCVLLLPFKKIKSPIYQLQKDSLEKSNERAVVSEMIVLTNFFLENCRMGLCNLLLMGVGQDQQQHPAVHTWVVQLHIQTVNLTNSSS